MRWVDSNPLPLGGMPRQPIMELKFNHLISSLQRKVHYAYHICADSKHKSCRMRPVSRPIILAGVVLCMFKRAAFDLFEGSALIGLVAGRRLECQEVVSSSTDVARPCLG